MTVKVKSNCVICGVGANKNNSSFREDIFKEVLDNDANVITNFYVLVPKILRTSSEDHKSYI